MSNLPNIRPSLLLDFANTRSLDPRVTFTRASGGTHFNAQGLLVTAGNDRPRFDHDPVTGQSLGLLVEESRTNLLLRSEEFDVSPWGAVNATVTANVTATAAPDGTNTADKLVVNNLANLSDNYGYQNVPKSAASITYTASIYAKAGEYSRVSVLVNDNNNLANRASVLISLADGSVVTAAAAVGTFTSASVVVNAVGNGWYRLGLVFTSGTETLLRLRIYNTHDGTTTGDGTSGIFIWGAQLEAGAFPTSYVRTVDAQVTRAADVASITGSNFSGWNNAAGGTILARYSAGGWKTNNTPPTDPLNLRKDVSDYSTDITDRVRRMMFYPRQLTADQITAITA
jgi:hypothetical protein